MSKIPIVFRTPLLFALIFFVLLLAKISASSTGSNLLLDPVVMVFSEPSCDPSYKHDGYTKANRYFAGDGGSEAAGIWNFVHAIDGEYSTENEATHEEWWSEWTYEVMETMYGAEYPIPNSACTREGVREYMFVYF